MQKTLFSFLRLVGEIPKPFEITLCVAARFCKTLELPPAYFQHKKRPEPDTGENRYHGLPDLLQGADDEDPVLFIEPAVLCGEIHTFQNDPVKHFCLG